MSRRRLLSSLVTVVTVLASSAGAGAVERPASGWIVYPSESLDGAQIVSVPVVAGRQRALAFTNALPDVPALSPDGKLVAFVEERHEAAGVRAHIWVMTSDGRSRRRLVEGSALTWSPDGRRLAFVDGLGHLSAIGRDGSARQRVVARSGLKISGPLWSPDGGWIAYSLGDVGEDRLWVVRADGTGSHRVTRARPLGYSWSPNGRRLAYGGSIGGKEDIYTVSVNGGRPRRLTNDTWTEAFPQWSPDGKRIAFWRAWTDTMVVAADGSRPARRVARGSGPSWSPDGSMLAVVQGQHLWVVRLDGSGVRKVSRGTGNPSGNVEFDGPARPRAVWTPDGRRIIFSRLSYLPGELLAVSPSGDRRRRVTRNRTTEIEPAWSPDGRSVAFVRVLGQGRSSKQEICVIRADGTRFRRLTHGSVDSQPTWSPDGTRIVFTRRSGAGTFLNVVPASGGVPRRLAAVTKGHPAWAPGSLIALDGIELVRPTGEPAGRVTQPPEGGSDSQPDWAPDGRSFVFVRFEDPPCRQCEIQYLAVGEVGSDSVRAIPLVDVEYTSPSWSPDGSRIAAVVIQGGPLVTLRTDGSDRKILIRRLADEPEIDWGPGP